MKSIITTVLFFIGAFATLAQNYKPILDYRNEWHFTTCDFGCYTDKYYTDGDTLVGGKMYKILEILKSLNRKSNFRNRCFQ